MGTILNDLRFAVRLAWRAPSLTLVAVLSLGLGIGANTTIFSLVNEVFLTPLPMRDAGRLVTVFTSTDPARAVAGAVGSALPMSRLNYEDYRDRNAVFDGLSAVGFTGLSLSSGQGEPEQVAGQVVTSNYFAVMQPPMAAGSGFTAHDDAALGASPMTVLSYGLWQRRFGGAPSIVGESITLNGRAFTVVGVAGAAFRGAGVIGGPDLWVPFAMYRETTSGFLRENWDSRRALVFQVLGRLKPGVSIDTATANLATIAAALSTDHPVENDGRGIALAPLAETALSPNPAQRQQFTTAGALLMVVVGLVLLIACANVANLLLSRAAARRQEIAIRLSLGAGRGRLVRQLLVESGLLGVMGGLTGLLIASWARAALLMLRPPFLDDGALAMPIDMRVLAFTALVAIGTGLLFGLVPALQFSRPDLVVELKDRSSQPGGGRRLTIRNALVVGQVALSLVALIGAGLFIRSLGNARAIDPGFDASALGVLSFNLTAQGLPLEAAADRQRDILERARGIPGVDQVTLASRPPLGGGGFARSVFLEGQDTADPRNGRFVPIAVIGDAYFEAAGIPLLRGRTFGPADRPGSPQVVVINETMAERFWPDRDAVGQRFHFFGQPSATEVVGIARNSKYNAIGEEPQPYIYQSLDQVPQAGITLIVRSQAPETALGAVRAAVQQMEPAMPITGVFTMEALFDQGLWAPRMGATLLGVFGGLALLLAAVGVYGVMAYAVGQRSREIGVRLALGATRRDIWRLVFRQGLLLTASGVICGLAVAAVAARLIVGLLYDVGAFDPITFVVIPGILLAVAAVAIYIPARRASRVDPVIALRSS